MHPRAAVSLGMGLEDVPNGRAEASVLFRVRAHWACALGHRPRPASHHTAGRGASRRARHCIAARFVARLVASPTPPNVRW
jgi:hypothetical protein